jgi:ATP-dependent helicase HrpA
VRGGGARGRIIVIAPTRAACETIELAFGLDIETVLWKSRGAEMSALAARLAESDVRPRQGFGIVAGTGTGKTLSVKPIAKLLLDTDELRVGVVNREREATPETPSWNVVIVTTGIARRWFQDGDIRPHDTLVVDEIHQTSAELELCLALGKRTGCRFVWLSATVDPSFYSRYLNAAAVVESSAFDPTKAAKVEVERKKPVSFLDDRFVQRAIRERRGIGVFLPTRAGVEEVAMDVGTRYPRMQVAFYHGGEPIRVIRPFLEGESQKPFLLAMTAAGQSALNVQGLDTVVIDDTRFANVVERGRNVLTRLHLGANEILQMAGRVHGRVAGGRVFILSDRDIKFDQLRPTAPEFQLAGDSERVALTCAALGVRADELDLPVPLDVVSYRNSLAFLATRGIIDNGRLTEYGRAVEAMPVDRAWAELLVHCDDELLPVVAVMASVESLHRMTREDRDLTGLIVPGSDHLTTYNVYAEAFTKCGYLGEVYGLPRQLFDESIERWSEGRGVLVKSVEDSALAMASIYRSVGLPLPTKMPRTTPAVEKKWIELLARIMPFSLVIDEQTADGDEARVSKTSVCGSWGPVAGTLRYFADKFGVARAAIEGTQLPRDLVRAYAHGHEAKLVYDPSQRERPFALERRLTYFGFELEREREPVVDFPAGMEAEARRVLAEALARGEARHPAIPRNRPLIDEVREVWRRSGGRTPRFQQPELTAWYAKELEGVKTLAEFRSAALRFDPDVVVPAAERARWMALPSSVMVREKPVALHYEIEEDADGGATGVVRLHLPEKIARSLVEEELPTLDRPVRFAISRGARGTIRANTLDEAQEELSRPWMREEASAGRRGDRSSNGRGGRFANGRGGRPAPERGTRDERGPGESREQGPGTGPYRGKPGKRRRR